MTKEDKLIRACRVKAEKLYQKKLAPLLVADARLEKKIKAAAAAHEKFMASLRERCPHSKPKLIDGGPETGYWKCPACGWDENKHGRM